MDPTQKQEAKYKVKNLMGIMSDKTAVGMAKIRGEEGAALDVAVLKATLTDEVVPKEKHVRTLKIACSGSAPRQQVNYVIHALGKRFEDKPGWLVTLKALMVFHRLMRETDVSFQEELLRYSERTGMHRLLRMDSFADHTTKETWDFSAWIRVYSVYLDERLSVFRTMKFDPEQDTGLESRESKLKSCPAPELLEHLPAVQRLLSRLISCVPEGAAQRNDVVIQAATMVLKELRSLYKAVCEGIINLADKFFEMERGEALKGLELYKENLALNERLNAYVASINNIPPLRGAAQFPTLQSLPADFLTTLEDYVRDAPKNVDPNAANTARKAGGPPPAMIRASSHAARGGTTSAALGGPTRLVVGAPITDTSPAASPTTTTSPPPAAAKPPQIMDLLDFDSLTITSPTQAKPTGAPVGQSFDPFSQSAAGGYGQPQGYPPQQQQQQQQQHLAPQQGLAPPAFNSNPAFNTAFAVPHNQQAPPPPSNPFGDSAFGGGAPAQKPAPSPIPAGFSDGFNFADNGYGAPQQQHQQQHLQQHQPQQQAFNPFGGQAASPAGPHGYVAAPSPVAAGFSSNPFGSPPVAPQPGANPFGGAPPANPFGNNPFGGAPPAYGAPAPNANPFGAPPGAPQGWGASPPPGQAPGGYSLRKQPDPLMDLSVDLFGKQAQQPHLPTSMRDMKQPQNGSPNAFF